MFAALNELCSACSALLVNTPQYCPVGSPSVGAQHTDSESVLSLTLCCCTVRISGVSSAFAPQTFLKIVVFPAFARPITRMRKCVHSARRSRALREISIGGEQNGCTHTCSWWAG